MTIKLRPGQVLNFKYNNIFSKAIAMGMGNYWTHTGWVVRVEDDDVYIQEALGSRTKKVTTSKYSLDWLNKLYSDNKLKVMDFRINDDLNFQNYVKSIEGEPYDYYAILELFLGRVFSLLGLNIEKYLSFSILGKFRLKINKNATSKKKVDCSEAIARAIFNLKGFEVLRILNVDKFEQVTPERISILFDKLSFYKLI